MMRKDEDAAESRYDEEDQLFDKSCSSRVDPRNKINLEIQLARVWREQRILRTAIDDMVNSAAWRMTGPARTLVSWIRKARSSLKSPGEPLDRARHGESALPGKSISNRSPTDGVNLEIRLAQAWSEHRRLSNEIDDIVNSTTWRMTAPVRDFFLGVKRTGRYRRLKGITANLLSAADLLGREVNNRPPFREIKNQVFYLADILFRDAGVLRNMISMRQLAAKRCDASAWHGLQEAPSEGYPCIDIGVVTFNNKKWLPIFMSSLLAQHYPLEKIALIVVDHSSLDGTMDMWRALEDEHGSRFRRFVVMQQGNLGFGQGQNLAFRHCTARYFLVSNVDLEFEPDALIKIVAAATREGDALGSLEFRQKPYEHPKYYDPVTFETAWSAHSCVLFNRDAFAAVGGYEKRIFMYGEDTELSYRLRDSGFSVKYCPQAVAWHYYYQEQDPEELKPLQFKGNTVANSFIRIRYGAWADILRIPGMFIGLTRSRYRHREPLKEVAESCWTVLRNLFYFLVTRKQSKLVFPFHDWDFERRREGAFYRQLRSPERCLPIVTVIIRTCPGRNAYLCEALQSVANQTYSNIEIIILEAGGATAAPLAEQLRSRYSLSICHLALPALGRPAVANIGLSLAQGEYFMFLDDGAMLFSDHVEILVYGLLNEPEREAAYALSMEIKSIHVGNSQSTYHEVEYVSPENLRQPFDRAELLNRNFIPIQSLLFHRSLYRQYGGFDENLADSAEWDLWLRYSYRNDFLFIEKTTSLHRSFHHPGKMQEYEQSAEASAHSIRLKHETPELCRGM